MLIIIRRVLSLGFLCMGVVFLMWAYWPVKHQVVTVTLTPQDMQLPSSEVDVARAILEQRLARLEWPRVMRVSDEYQVQLDFSPVLTTSASGHMAEYSDIYTSYNVMAEAQYEASGLSVDPSTPTRESLRHGQILDFIWDIRADRPGEYHGALWLSLRFLPLDGSAPSQAPVFIQAVRLPAISLFGLSAPMVRLFGGVGMLLFVFLETSDMINLLRKITVRH